MAHVPQLIKLIDDHLDFDAGIGIPYDSILGLQSNGRYVCSGAFHDDPNPDSIRLEDLAEKSFKVLLWCGAKRQF